jgi:hypothetical protein
VLLDGSTGICLFWVQILHSIIFGSPFRQQENGNSSRVPGEFLPVPERELRAALKGR